MGRGSGIRKGTVGEEEGQWDGRRKRGGGRGTETVGEKKGLLEKESRERKRDNGSRT